MQQIIIFFPGDKRSHSESHKQAFWFNPHSRLQETKIWISAIKSPKKPNAVRNAKKSLKIQHSVNNISPRNRTQFALQWSHASCSIYALLAGSEEKESFQWQTLKKHKTKKTTMQCWTCHPPTHSLLLLSSVIYMEGATSAHLPVGGIVTIKNICKYRMGTEGKWGRDEEECKYLITTEAFETSTQTIWRDWIWVSYCVYAAH